MFLRTEMLTKEHSLSGDFRDGNNLTHHVILNVQCVIIQGTNAYIEMDYMGYDTQIAQGRRNSLVIPFPKRSFFSLPSGLIS